MKWLILFLGIVSNTAASILVKVAITAPRKFPSFSEPVAALMNWPFWLGIMFYGATFIFYAAALTRLPLNIAHPVLTSGAVAAVALSSLFIFREPFHWTTIIGIFLVIVGVMLITVRGL